MGTLHVIATPIGNLEDVTLRALAALRESELLFAEDTRRTRILLDRHAIPVRARSLHAHNEAERCAEALAALAEGRRVALVSDAGTPTISDPGARLVAEAIAAGHAVIALPGASAVLAALVVSGLPSTPFTFVGFLPRRGRERTEQLATLRARPETLVLFESPQRIAETLAELAEAFGGERRACVARELTKLHEEAARGTLAELAARFAEGARGEITLVVEGAPPEAAAPPLAAEALRERMAALLARGLSPRDAADTLRAETRLPRRALYALALELKGARAEPIGSDPIGSADETERRKR
jgi:16S rRNA (cytidine1402-2'-O)-methyltransferase